MDIDRALKAKKISVGDRVGVTKDGFTVEGMLLPRIELSDTSSLVIKQDNGYNVGIRYGKGVEIEFLGKGKAVSHRHAVVEAQHDSKKPLVSIMGAGGTIASRVEYDTGAVFPEFSPGDLLKSFPQLKGIANVKGRELFRLFSEDMTPEHWKIIAKESAREIESGADGVVLMHGTDTMNYTAAALSFMLQSLPAPVVVVGAQRSSDRGSSDNLMNLVCATNAAAHSDVAEVSVCMHATSNDDYCYLHQGNKVRKMHTSRRDAFRSINTLPYAKLWFSDAKVEYLRSDYSKRSGRKIRLDDKMNPDVGLIQIHPGIKPELIEASKKFFDGVVLSGTGLGHVPTNPSNEKFAQSVVPAVRSLVDSGVPVVMAPQTIYGRLDLNVYSAGRLLKQAGVIGDGADWLPETALVKLMWVLGHTKDMDKVREMMSTNFAGELSKDIEPSSFLV
ncbi:MAG: Glu-tRNA(Gln) amidotransferase subunit GatD [Candidatus Aenigmarchaeota archaeon]|nr:Glu-tRNA(Gln) amidotransferase subunit GatD [Candidatus Aenigmarchaeota archaeon]